MRYHPLLICALTAFAAGCSVPSSSSLSLDIGSLTPYHCVQDHDPFHCPINNLTIEVENSTAYANLTIESGAVEPPYVLDGATDITLEVGYAAPAGSANVNATVAIEPTPGLTLPGVSNRTFELAPGDTEEVSFTVEQVDGWPARDYILPRLVFGVDDAWTSKRLFFVTADGLEEVEEGGSTLPFGPLAIAALAAAAVLALPRRRQ